MLLKNSDSKFLHMEIWFPGQNSELAEIKYSY